MRNHVENLLASHTSYSKWYTWETVDSTPTEKGSYILLIFQNSPITLNHRKLGQHILPAGYYLYAGSANGGGGIRARVKRHLSPTKKIHWHIDYLTTHGAEISCLCFPSDNECRLITTLSKSETCIPPIPGFGSSDCKTCSSHLLQITMLTI